MKEKFTYCIIFDKDQQNAPISEFGKIGITENLPSRLNSLVNQHKRKINIRRSFYIKGDHEKLLLDATKEWQHSGIEYRHTEGIIQARKIAKNLNLEIINLNKLYKAIQIAALEKAIAAKKASREQAELYERQMKERNECIEAQTNCLPHPLRIYYLSCDWTPKDTRGKKSQITSLELRLIKLKKTLLNVFLTLIKPNYHQYFRVSEGAENNMDCIIYGWYKKDNIPIQFKIERYLDDTSNVFATRVLHHIAKKYKTNGLNAIYQLSPVLPINEIIKRSNVERLIRLIKETVYTNDILVDLHFYGPKLLEKYDDHEMERNLLKARDYGDHYHYTLNDTQTKASHL